MKKFLFALALIFSVFCNAKADSPLTSTDFWRAYSNEEIIIRINADDISSNEILNYLVNKKNPVAVKMAVVNRMGWDIEGMSRAEWLYTYAAGYYKVTTFEDFCKKAPADVLLCYAYLLAMDDYFNV
ncbi:MAG: hypothetical protein HUK15_01685, partial [Bacteroidales bacterium]|nr:hypothetical protein [Bacteroidales bacterium]